MPQVGESLQGKLDLYTLEKQLVEGRFGNTYLARRASDGEAMVVKTIDFDHDPTWSDIQEFEELGAKLMQLDHPNIAAYLDVIAIQGIGETSCFGMVQSRSEKQVLSEWITSQTNATLESHIQWLEQVLLALVYIHEQEPALVHADLDWGNVLIGEDGDVDVVDFATIRQQLLQPATLAQGLVRGTLDFSPMEMMLGHATPATDMYALAMTFLAATSRKHPSEFPLQGMRPDVEAMLPVGAPSALGRLLSQMTEADPIARLDNARVALERVRVILGDASSLEDTPKDAQEEEGEEPGESLLKQETSLTVVPKERPASMSVPQVLYQAAQQSKHSLYNMESGRSWRTLPELERGRISAFGLDRDGNFMVLGHGHKGWGFQVGNFRASGDFTFEEVVQDIAVSRDGSHVAVLTGVDDLLFFDVQMSVWQKHSIKVDGMWPGKSQLTLSDDGKTVAIADDDQVNIYDWESGQMQLKLNVDGQHGLDYSDDGNILAAVGEEETTLIGPDFALEQFESDAMLFGPDGRSTAYSRGRAVYLVQVDTSVWPLNIEQSARKVTVEDAPAGMKFRVLRFSPDAKVLFVAGDGGFFRLIDVKTAQVMSRWEDRARANDTHQVKIFEAGFSANGSRLLVHCNLEEDALTGLKTGGVLAWDVETGRFLGSLLMLEGEPSALVPPLLHAPLSATGSQGYGEFRWERPELALPMWLGKDVSAKMTSLERSGLLEFGARFRALSLLQKELGPTANFKTLMEGTAGTGPVLGRVWMDAHNRMSEEQNRSYASTLHTLPFHLVDAAFALLGDYSLDELIAIHKGLITQSPARGNPNTVVPRTLEREEKEEELELDEARSQAASFLSQSIPSEAMVLPSETEIAKLTGTTNKPLAGAISLAIAYGGMFAVFAAIGPPDRSLVLGINLIAVAPLIAIVLYLGVFKKVIK